MTKIQQNYNSNNVPEYLLIAKEFIAKHDKSYITGEDKIYYINMLLKMKKDIIANNMSHQSIVVQSNKTSDEIEGATMWNDNYLSIISLESKRNSLLDIDRALQKLNNNTYGYCELTGEQINLNRLRIYPLARYCLDVQEKIDKKIIKID